MSIPIPNCHAADIEGHPIVCYSGRSKALGAPMSDMTMNRGMTDIPSPIPHLDGKPHVGGAVAFFLVLVAGLGYAAFNISQDISSAGEHNLAIGAFVLLGIALL